ncbi:hypothetical protein [Nitrincola alkalisediminis]|uniref:hypothetical protein n=1 Tax=Nitrincola alkalisediminis TaxID=1366656 RepID=UPI0018774BC8|nr:hypothetical protein [Nitrincola alkalisediminis]
MVSKSNWDGFEPKEFWESFDVFAEHMPGKEQTELCILKGHLLVEETLNRIIKKRLAAPTYIAEARLEFSQKLALARSLLVLNEEDRWVWDGVRKLNETRNRLAHRLVDSGINDKVTDFTSFVESSLAAPSQQDQMQEFGELTMSIFNVYVTLNWASA